MALIPIHDPSRLNRRAVFLKQTPYQAKNGVNKDHYEPDFSVWCAIYTRTINQTYQLTGTELEDTQTMIIRHNENVLDSMHVQLGNQNYRIISITPDTTPSPIAYDTLTIKEVTK